MIIHKEKMVKRTLLNKDSSHEGNQIEISTQIVT